LQKVVPSQSITQSDFDGWFLGVTSRANVRPVSEPIESLDEARAEALMGFEKEG
jgi:hypothetical protein